VITKSGKVVGVSVQFYAHSGLSRMISIGVCPTDLTDDEKCEVMDYALDPKRLDEAKANNEAFNDYVDSRQ